MFRRFAPRTILLVVMVAVAAGTVAHASSLQQRRAAIDRALAFLQTTASSDANVAQYGADLLWCFYSISHTAQDRGLGESALRMGRELAVRWRQTHQHVPANAAPLPIFALAEGAYAAEKLGFPDPQLKAELKAAAVHFTAHDFIEFDARTEPPRAYDPKRYDKWTDALIRTYMGDAYGVQLGANYRDVIQWLPNLAHFEGLDEDTEFDAFYAVTHVIYTLNHYQEQRVTPALLPAEFAFLRRKLGQAMSEAESDPETVGEAVDCLKAGGFERDPQVRKGMDFLIATQRSDGSWAGDADDVYTQYHSAWTGIDGLRDYRFRGKVKSIPSN